MSPSTAPSDPGRKVLTKTMRRLAAIAASAVSRHLVNRSTRATRPDGCGPVAALGGAPAGGGEPDRGSGGFGSWP
jgi:hypothetical protein